MYWIFLIIFIITVLVPDIVRSGYLLLSEARIEEILIFLLGAIAFIIFMKNEQQLAVHKKEKEKDKRKIEQTVKDLVESYSYIGEVNRKMDLLMNTALGLSDRSTLNTSHENETYKSIISAASFLFKADFATLRFVDLKNKKTKKEFRLKDNRPNLKNDILLKSKDNATVEKYKDFLIVSSNQAVENIKSFIIISGFDPEEEENPKNIEILKVFASQALFLYAFTHKEKPNCPPAKK